MPDADLTTAILAIVYTSFGNNREARVTITRVLLPDSPYDEIGGPLVPLASERVVGNPQDDSTARLLPAAQNRYSDRVSVLCQRDPRRWRAGWAPS